MKLPSAGRGSVVVLLLLFVGLNLGGCAAMKSSALNANMDGVDLATGSIALMTLKISNKYVPNYQPNVARVLILEGEAGTRTSCGLDRKYKEVKREYNEYLLSFRLPPGSHTIHEMSARSGIFPVMGNFIVPVRKSFQLPAGKCSLHR